MADIWTMLLGGAAAPSIIDALNSGTLSGDEAMSAAEQGLQEIIDLMRPSIEAQQGAMSAYQDILSGETDITQRAGYQAGLQTGQRAVETSAAARGMQLSGQNIEDLAGFGTQYYQSQRQAALGELAGLAGIAAPGMQAGLGAMGEMASLPMQQYQMQLAAQQGQAASQAGMLGGLGQLAIGAAMLMSDIRTKEDISYLTTIDDVRLYSFKYKPEFSLFGEGKQLGVVAQEILETHPEAVVPVAGWYMVDYSKLPVGVQDAVFNV